MLSACVSFSLFVLLEFSDYVFLMAAFTTNIFSPCTVYQHSNIKHGNVCTALVVTVTCNNNSISIIISNTIMIIILLTQEIVSLVNYYEENFISDGVSDVNYSLQSFSRI